MLQPKKRGKLTDADSDLFLIGRMVCSKSDSANHRSKLLRNSEINLPITFLI